jgi:hypothetical protein
MLPAIALAVAVNASGCGPSEDEDNRRWSSFLAEFVESLQADSDFHRQFSVVATPETLEELKGLGDLPFELDRCERRGSSRECYVRFSNGTEAVFDIHQTGGVVDAVGASVSSDPYNP